MTISHYKGLVTILFLSKAFFLKAMIFRNDCIVPKLLLNLKFQLMENVI